MNSRGTALLAAGVAVLLSSSCGGSGGTTPTATLPTPAASGVSSNMVLLSQVPFPALTATSVRASHDEPVAVTANGLSAAGNWGLTLSHRPPLRPHRNLGGVVHRRGHGPAQPAQPRCRPRGGEPVARDPDVRADRLRDHGGQDRPRHRGHAEPRPAGEGPHLERDLRLRAHALDRRGARAPVRQRDVDGDARPRPPARSPESPGGRQLQRLLHPRFLSARGRPLRVGDLRRLPRPPRRARPRPASGRRRGSSRGGASPTTRGSPATGATSSPPTSGPTVRSRAGTSATP